MAVTGVYTSWFVYQEGDNMPSLNVRDKIYIANTTLKREYKPYLTREVKKYILKVNYCLIKHGRI